MQVTAIQLHSSGEITSGMCIKEGTREIDMGAGQPIDFDLTLSQTMLQEGYIELLVCQSIILMCTEISQQLLDGSP